MLARLPSRVFAVCVVAISVAGCTRREYQIEMSLGDDGLHRRLTAWQERTENDRTIIDSLNPAELDTLRSAYGADGRLDDEGRMVFEGLIDDVTPSDVGGMVTVARWTTSLGTLTAYSERVRGSDDLVGRWEERMQKIDRSCELMSGWAAENAVDAEQGANVTEFIRGPLRDDLKNVAMHCFAFAAMAPLQNDRKLFEETVARLIQFGIEHDYVTAQDIRLVHRLGMSADSQEVSDIILSILDHKRGTGATPFKEIIPALQSVETLEASLADYLADTPEADELRQRASNNDLDREDLLGIPVDLLWEAMLFGVFFGGGDHVSIRFATEQEPFVTNGEWDPATQSVTWNNSVESRGSEPYHVLPTLCYASWTEPDSVFQSEHFGRVVFTGKQLAEYTIWYEGLDESEVEQWDRFIASFAPTDNLNQSFLRFRFEGEPVSSEEVSLLSDMPRRILRDALDNAEVGR